MRTKVTKQGIVWRHEVQLLEVTSMTDMEPRYMPGLPQYVLRVGHDDLTIRCYNGETLPPLASIASVDVWVDEEDEPNDTGGIPPL